MRTQQTSRLRICYLKKVESINLEREGTFVEPLKFQQKFSTWSPTYSIMILIFPFLIYIRIKQQNNNMYKKTISEENRCPLHELPIDSFCISQKCTLKSIALCKNCVQKHEHPIREIITIPKLNEMINQAYYNLDNVASKLKGYFDKLKYEFSRQIDSDQNILMYLIKKFEYCSQQQNYKTLNYIKDSEYEKLTVHRIRDLMQDLTNPDRREQIKVKVSNYTEEITSINQKIHNLFKSQVYKNLTLIKIFQNTKVIREFSSPMLNSQQQKSLYDLLKTEGGLSINKNPTLIFSAKQQMFSSKSFHEKVDGISPILTLIKTKEDRVFGCYLNCKLNSNKNWIADPSEKSFIFSLNKKTIHKLKRDPQSMQKAAYGGVIGPQFGSGCDIYICDRCDVLQNSGSELGGSYELPPTLKYRTTQSESYLADRKHFLVSQYEVYKL